ncbi:MAG: diacylglycerol kinase family lipid kinase [Acidobacteriia bacterium]|nr:diacylglycerol kinase family lipid kinase [Terriglobia bacterium]
MRITILLNPSARHGRARHLLEGALEVFRRHAVDFEVRESQSPQHLIELAHRAREQKPDLIVSAGGDGTHHYVLNGLFGSATPLGLIPIGRGNDFAKGIGMPRDPRAAATALLNGQVREVDLARVGPVVYGCVAGVGFDSTVNRYANERVRWLSGTLAYVWSLLYCLKDYRPEPLEITADEESFSGEVAFALVGNNSSYGGGIRLAPRAKLDDGLLDVCIIPSMGRLELLGWIPRAYRGEHLRHPRIRYFQARKITLRTTSRMELFGDGEFLQELPATIEVVPRALRVIVPR